jgi:hypothetical protein
MGGASLLVTRLEEYAWSSASAHFGANAPSTLPLALSFPRHQEIYPDA